MHSHIVLFTPTKPYNAFPHCIIYSNEALKCIPTLYYLLQRSLKMHSHIVLFTPTKPYNAFPHCFIYSNEAL